MQALYCLVLICFLSDGLKRDHVEFQPGARSLDTAAPWALKPGEQMEGLPPALPPRGGESREQWGRF